MFPVLITNEHVINKDQILYNRVIKISFDDDKISKNLDITNNRKIYSSKLYDITIIEVFPLIDNLSNFLELDNLDEIDIGDQFIFFNIQWV